MKPLESVWVRARVGGVRLWRRGRFGLGPDAKIRFGGGGEKGVKEGKDDIMCGHTGVKLKVERKFPPPSNDREQFKGE